jgi:catechol 2,3-dioxygenase-like lactoylglutathione lyase family enzyme
MRSPLIKQIDHLAIVVTDLERSRKFFEVLGFQETIRSTLDAAFLESVTDIKGAAGSFVGMKHQDSQLVIELLHFSSPKPVPDPECGCPNRVGFRHLAFSVHDIEQTVARLREFGVEFLSPIRTWEKTGKRLLYFRGPDGILMELAEYPEG